MRKEKYTAKDIRAENREINDIINELGTKEEDDYYNKLAEAGFTHEEIENILSKKGV